VRAALRDVEVDGKLVPTVFFTEDTTLEVGVCAHDLVRLHELLLLYQLFYSREHLPAASAIPPIALFFVRVPIDIQKNRSSLQPRPRRKLDLFGTTWRAANLVV
jgi:hypothetical protein